MAAMLVGGATISLSDLSNEELEALELLCEARLARIGHSDGTAPVTEDCDDSD
jgi:hypothetical protein